MTRENFYPKNDLKSNAFRNKKFSDESQKSDLWARQFKEEIISSKDGLKLHKLPEDVIENIQSLRKKDKGVKFMRERNTVYGAGFFEKH